MEGFILWGTDLMDLVPGVGATYLPAERFQRRLLCLFPWIWKCRCTSVNTFEVHRCHNSVFSGGEQWSAMKLYEFLISALNYKDNMRGRQVSLHQLIYYLLREEWKLEMTLVLWHGCCNISNKKVPPPLLSWHHEYTCFTQLPLSDIKGPVCKIGLIYDFIAVNAEHAAHKCIN